MDEGLLCRSTGYPVGDLHLMARLQAKQLNDNLTSLEFKNRRRFFLDLGIPESQLRTISPILLTNIPYVEQAGIPTDYSLGKNLPPKLS